MEEQEMRFCQSCGMPLTKEVLGTERDGTKNGEFCTYCYQNGAFTADVTMEGMIDICLDVCPQGDYSMYGSKSREEAKGQMLEWFPTLSRWKR